MSTEKFALDPKDLRVDTYLTGGTPGVRITHIPSGICAECDGNRSQQRNREFAMVKLTELVAAHTLGQLQAQQLVSDDEPPLPQAFMACEMTSTLPVISVNDARQYARTYHAHMMRKLGGEPVGEVAAAEPGGVTGVRWLVPKAKTPAIGAKLYTAPTLPAVPQAEQVPEPCANPASCAAQGCINPRGRCEEAAESKLGGGESIESTEFIGLLCEFLTASPVSTETQESEQTAAKHALIAHIDAKLAQARAAAIPELRKAFITLESSGGEGRTIILKFNQCKDAYAVHDFLLKGGGQDYRERAAGDSVEDCDCSQGQSCAICDPDVSQQCGVEGIDLDKLEALAKATFQDAFGNPKNAVINAALKDFHFAADPVVVLKLIAAARGKGGAGDHDEAVLLLSAVFDAWENGTECYENPSECAHFIGTAFKLDSDIFNRCCNLLNRLNPPRNAPSGGAGVPDGFMLVPKEPTPRMLALWSQMRPEDAREIWERMLLAAAPAITIEAAEQAHVCHKDAGRCGAGGYCAECPNTTTKAVEQPKQCAWKLDDPENGIWQSACGESWSFVEGGPAENFVRFCQGCGKSVELVATSTAGVVCPQCGVDRLKEPCPGMADECAMIADAHLVAQGKKHG